MTVLTVVRRRMGSLPLRWEDCILWMVLPFWYVVLTSFRRARHNLIFTSPFPHHGPRYLHSPLRSYFPGFLIRPKADLFLSYQSNLLYRQLPTLYFAVLMFAHVLDHCFFSAKRFSEKSKNVIFGVNVFLQLAMFYWFKELAWGIEGPISEYQHRGWRSVSSFTPVLDATED